MISNVQVLYSIYQLWLSVPISSPLSILFSTYIRLLTFNYFPTILWVVWPNIAVNATATATPPTPPSFDFLILLPTFATTNIIESITTTIRSTATIITTTTIIESITTATKSTIINVQSTPTTTI